MTKGHEVGVLQLVRNPRSTAERTVDASLRESERWFEARWRDATAYAAVADDYRSRFRKEPPRIGRTDDDSVQSSRPAVRLAIPADRLAALGKARFLWMDTERITRNLGVGRPGNQVPMSAFTRVFFGASADEVPKKTLVAEPRFQHPTDSNVVVRGTVRYAGNSMDVISVPAPGSPWAATYDHRTMLFEKVARGSALHFILTVRSQRAGAPWRRLSAGQGTLYKMKGKGRQWGVFD